MDNYPELELKNLGGGADIYFVGSRIRVLHVIQTYKASDNNIDKTVAYFAIEKKFIDDALRYYHDHPKEIDRKIEEYEEAFEDYLKKMEIETG
jgi:uncharacterized protein (DUF433 family)